MNTYELVAQTRRNGQVESQHFGTVVAFNPDAIEVDAAGNVYTLDDQDPSGYISKFKRDAKKLQSCARRAKYLRTSLP